MSSVSSPKKGKGKKSVRGGVPSWLFFPPTLLLPIIMVFYITGNSWEAARPPLSFTAVFLMIYGALSLAYCSLFAKNNRKGANSVSMLAHGAAIVFLANWMGASAAFSWLGGVVFLFGAINAISLLTPARAPRFAKVNEAILPVGTDRSVARQILDAIVLPAAFLEFDEGSVERVFAANEPLSALLGRGADKMQGVAFASLLPPQSEGAKYRFLDMDWVARRATKGTQTLFMLSPLEKAAEPPIVQVLDAIDPNTGLFTQSFLRYKGKSDVEGCRRYKRNLALCVLRLDFERRGNIPPSEDARKAAFDAFGRMVVGTIRDCDSAYRANDTEILLFMPDTAWQGAKVVVSRIRDRMRKVAAIECAELGMADLIDGTVGFMGEDAKSLDHVIEEGYIAIKRENSL